MSAYLVEIVGADASGNLTTFRYATEGFNTRPDEIAGYLPSTHYDGRVTNPGVIQQDAYGAGLTFGPSEVGGGLVELANDGALDALRDYGFDGRSMLVRRGDPGDLISDMPVVFSGTIEQLVIQDKVVTVRARDWVQNLMVALQDAKFGGTNSLPNGLDGVAEDLKGKPKPIWLGYVYNAAPPCVNTSRLIYQLHCQAFANDTVNTINWALSAVYDKRVPLTAGALKTLAQFQAGSTNLTFTVVAATNIFTTAVHSYTTADAVSVDVTGGTLAAPLVNTTTYYVRVLSTTTFTLHPTAADANANTNVVDITTTGSGTQTVSNNRTAVSSYDWCNDTTGFYIRLGSTPAGQVTVDALNPYKLWVAGPPADQYSAMTNAYGLWHWLLYFRCLTRIAFGVSDVVLPGTDARSQGVFITEEMTLLDAMNTVLASAGAFVYAYPSANASGEYMVDRLDLTQTVPVFTFDADCVMAIEQDAPEDSARGLPAWRVNLSYRRNWTPMSDADLAGGITVADRAWLANEWRTVVSEDSAVKTQYPNSPELNRSTLLTDATHAATEATRVRDIYKVRRTVHRVTVPLSLCDGLRLADLVNVTYPRFGLDAGVNFWVIGMQQNLQDETMQLTLWK
jgi:hypothetical protein